MRGKRFLLFAAAAMLSVSIPYTAAAQETPEDYADQWSEARRGDRDWMERATEELTTGLADRLFGKAAEGTMKEIVNVVTGRVEAMRNVSQNSRHGPCQSAALEQAFGQAIDTGHQEVLAGAGGMLLSALQGAAGGGGWQEFLGKRLAEQLGEKLRDQALDEFKKQMRERMRQGSPEHFEDDYNAGGCRTEFRVVWDKAQERYMFLMAGDCGCNRVSCGPHYPGRQVQLARWTLEGWGTVIPEITQAANGEKRVRYRIGAPQDVSLTADCCQGDRDRRYSTLPRNGAGNEWVGFVRRPQTGGTPPRRPQTGSTPPPRGSSARPAPQTEPPVPAGPPRRQIDIPEVPERPMTREELEELGERLHATHERARDVYRSAFNYRAALDDRQPPPSDAEIRDADAAVEEAANAAGRARAALDKVLEKFNELDQQQSSRPLDPASARMLAIHNAERAAVGVPPLRWDPALQASATAYAAHLARTGRLVHAPRTGRTIERENLSQGLIGWSPDQMLASWVVEKRQFIPGTFPKVSRTGNWVDIGHYSQMIWPTTTNVGCGMATGSGHQWLVCRYSPGGNKDGHQVGRPPTG